MSRRKKAAVTARIEAAAQEVERQKPESRQPRFEPRQWFDTLWTYYHKLESEEPEYQADSRKRDAWLREYAREEPHLMGVLSSVVQVDKNRGWNLTGGRNQVNRFTAILHGSQAAQDVTGWRPFMEWASQSFYGSDIGCVVEKGREGKNGPLRRMYSVDPAQCRLTGNPDWPLEFHGTTFAAGQKWANEDYFRIASLTNTSQDFNGLGYSAVSRCLELVKVLVAVYKYDQEMLGARMPSGLLLLKGITREQFEEAMKERAASLSRLHREAYGGVQVLATDPTLDINPEAQLVALSSLPANFDREKFVNQVMYAYALSFGYDPREFWPVSSGSLGTATETEVQHTKATGKGGLDFVLALQEKIQEELPETLAFEFEQRDEEGELMSAQLRTAKVDAVLKAFMSPSIGQEGLITRDEARQLLVEEGVIPGEWTEGEEEVQSSDTEAERYLDAARAFPDEPIVRYEWRCVGDRPKWVMRTLWGRGQDAFKPKRRQAKDVLYQGGDVKISQADVDRAIESVRKEDPELAQVLEAKPWPPEAERLGAQVGRAVKRLMGR